MIEIPRKLRNVRTCLMLTIEFHKSLLHNFNLTRLIIEELESYSIASILTKKI